MSKSPEVFSAEQAAIAAFQQNQRRGRKKYVMGMEVSQYAGFRVPGVDQNLLFGDPTCILKDRESKRKEDYTWRKPDDAYTVNMCVQQILRPVYQEEVDKSSVYANVVYKKIIYKSGANLVVQSPGGLGLYKINNQEAMNKNALAMLPGSHWEKQYLSDLAEQPNRWSEDVEHLSMGSGDGQIRPLDVQSGPDARVPMDTKREPL